MKLWIFDSRLWIEYDERGIGWTIADLERHIRRVPGAESHAIRADSARPETIEELRRCGLRVSAAPKWKGSVEDGVEHLRSYEEICLHPRCTGLITEARLWSYKTDSRTGDVLPALKPGYEHGWDATRYGLSPLIKRGGRVVWAYAGGA